MIVERYASVKERYASERYASVEIRECYASVEGYAIVEGYEC